MSESDPSPRMSIYQALGAGSVADVLLWKKQCEAILVLVSATAFWFLFEPAGYNILSFAANVMLLLAVILFFWAKSASLFNRAFLLWRAFLHLVGRVLRKCLEAVSKACPVKLRNKQDLEPLPPLPDLQINEDSVMNAADEIRLWINPALSIAQDVTVGRNFKLFLKVTIILWVASIVGSFFNFLTLIYIGILISMSIPVFYDKYQDHVDDKWLVTHKILRTYYGKIDGNIRMKIPIPLNKEKKLQ